MTNNITNYIIYLSIKLIIKSEICINNKQIIENEFVNYKKINSNYKDNDFNNIEFTKDLFEKYKFYNVIDIEYAHQLKQIDAINIYNMYKIYKQSINQQNLQKKSNKKKKSNIVLDNSIDTNDIYYLDSFNNIDINTFILEKLFGKPLTINEEKCRYEYKFKFNIKKEMYKISLYDWKDESNNFEEYDKIEWHIGSNNNNKNVIRLFKNTIKQMKLEKEHNSDHEDDCC